MRINLKELELFRMKKRKGGGREKDDSNLLVLEGLSHGKGI